MATQLKCGTHLIVGSQPDVVSFIFFVYSHLFRSILSPLSIKEIEAKLWKSEKFLSDDLTFTLPGSYILNRDSQKSGNLLLSNLCNCGDAVKIQNSLLTPSQEHSLIK